MKSLKTIKLIPNLSTKAIVFCTLILGVFSTAHAFQYETEEKAYATDGYYISASSGYVNGTESVAIEKATYKVQTYCSGKISNIRTTSSCDWYEQSWNRYRVCQAEVKATCTRILLDDVDESTFKTILRVDGLANSVKVASLVKQGKLDSSTYLETRAGLITGTDSFSDAGRISMAVVNAPKYKECYLTLRKGPRSGENTYEEAVEACNAIDAGQVDNQCYLMNRKGPQFGDKSHSDAMAICKTH